MVESGAMSSAPASTTSSTPILDRLAPLPAPEKPSRRSHIAAAVIWVLLAFALVLASQVWLPADVVVNWFAQIMQGSDAGDLSVWVFLLHLGTLALAFFLTVAVHEAAHALVGVGVGFHFNSLRVGRLQFDRPFRISLYQGTGTGAGGWASLIPAKHDQLRARAIAMLLAGPASNLLTVAALVWLPFAKGIFAAQLLYLSAFLGVVNLIPFRSRVVYSDGGRVLMLLANRARGERWLAMLKLVDELWRGVAPAAMTKEFVAKAVALEDESPDTVSAHAVAHAVAFWTRNDGEAARTLEVCLRHAALAAPVQRQALMSTAATFQARRRQRVDLAEQWQAELPANLEHPWTRAWGEAAIPKGDLAGVRQKLAEIEELARKWPNEAVRTILQRSLERWRAELGE